MIINCTPGIRCTVGRSIFFVCGVCSAWAAYTGNTRYPEFFELVSYFYIPTGILILLYVKTFTVDSEERTLTERFTLTGKTKVYKLDDVKMITILPLQKNLANMVKILPDPGLMHVRFDEKTVVTISKNETNRGYDELKEYFKNTLPDTIDSYE